MWFVSLRTAYDMARSFYQSSLVLDCQTPNTVTTLQTLTIILTIILAAPRAQRLVLQLFSDTNRTTIIFSHILMMQKLNTNIYLDKLVFNPFMQDGWLTFSVSSPAGSLCSTWARAAPDWPRIYLSTLYEEVCPLLDHFDRFSISLGLIHRVEEGTVKMPACWLIHRLQFLQAPKIITSISTFNPKGGKGLGMLTSFPFRAEKNEERNANFSKLPKLANMC